MHEYRDGVIERALPGGGPGCRPTGRCRIPEDWRDVLADAVPQALRTSGVDPAAVIGIATDFTACTFVPTCATTARRCARCRSCAARPHAWPKLWKHHAAQAQADRINDLAHERGETWIGRYGGRISSEWQFAKALQVLEEDPETYRRTERWIEAADWIVWQLCGAETRNACTAGYKGIYQDGAVPVDGLPRRTAPGLRRLRGRPGWPAYRCHRSAPGSAR